MNKKGAIEFSMTTIMVIIIGIAVLALGLAWVRGTFIKVGTLTEASLENAETILGEVAFTGKISAPATITMEKNDAKKFKVLVRNDEETEARKFKLEVTDKDDKDCVTPSVISGEVMISAGDTGELLGGLITSKCAGEINAFTGIKVNKYDLAGSSIEVAEYAVEAVSVQVRVAA